MIQSTPEPVIDLGAMNTAMSITLTPVYRASVVLAPRTANATIREHR
jgi:hypothetical protein